MIAPTIMLWSAVSIFVLVSTFLIRTEIHLRRVKRLPRRGVVRNIYVGAKWHLEAQPKRSERIISWCITLACLHFVFLTPFTVGDLFLLAAPLLIFWSGSTRYDLAMRERERHGKVVPIDGT